MNNSSHVEQFGQNRHLYPWWLSLLFLIVVIHSPFFVSRGAQNIGLVFHNLASIQVESAAQQRILEISQRWLSMSIYFAPDSEIARRAIGFNYLYMGCEGCALDSWTYVAGMHKELLQWADVKTATSSVETYSRAIIWTKLVVELAPEWGDGWYHLGMYYQEQQEWAKALNAYNEAVEKSHFDTPLRSDSYFRQGLIYQLQDEWQDSERSIAMYSAALQADEFSNDSIKAETFYKRGEVYGREGYPPAETLQQFEEALRLMPGHTWARLRKGIATYDYTGDWRLATGDIEAVIKVWEVADSPNLKWAYRHLGDIYYDAGLIPQAGEAYHEALEIDPVDEYTLEILATLDTK